MPKKQKLKPKRDRVIEAFHKAASEHTHLSRVYRNGSYVWEDVRYPIPAGKYRIHKDAVIRNQTHIRCRRCWSRDVAEVALKVAKQLGCKVSKILSIGSFGTAYDAVTIYT